MPSSAATKSCFPEASRSATNMAAVPVYSITRTEIDEFWRKEVEAEERRLAAEKEAARIKAKTLKVSPCS